MEIDPQVIQIDSKSFPIALDRSGVPVWEVQSGRRMVKEFVPGGPMGETRCTHQGVCNGYYFAQGFDTTDGTGRLQPGVTTAVANLDIAYTPLSFFEEYDSSSVRAVYITYRDTTTTPDLITKKIRPSDNTVIRTQTHGLATYSGPAIGRPEIFAGKTYVPLGNSTLLLQKLATVGDVASGAADTWESADAATYAYACASVMVDGTSKFARSWGDRKSVV